MNDSIYFRDSGSGMLFNSDEMQKKEKDGNIILTHIPLRNAMIVLMDHPAAITVYQYVSVEVISGSVSVFGYEIKPNNLPLTVFSSEKTGFIEIKTETFDRIWKKKGDSSNLETQLCCVTQDENKAREILRKFGNTTVAVVVRRCVFPPKLQFLELYYPHILEFNMFRKKTVRDSFYVPRSKGTPMEFGLDVEKLASEISLYVRGAKLTDNEAPVVLVCGPRGTGKSSLLRFLINKILSIYVVAYYLDADPGQAEFTPPGVVSLTKVTRPIIGPPFAHQQKPVSMVFTGGISADSSPDMYCKSIFKLMELYKERYSDEALFVNTMGWMEGLGLHCLQNVIRTVRPTVLIELVNEDEVSMFDYRDYLPEGSNYFQLCRQFTKKAAHPSSQEMRNLGLLTYLGKCQTSFKGPQYLNEIEPFCVSWDKIPVYLFGKKVPPYRMIEAINASIVALCNVPESVILESDIAQFPKTLEDEPDNECLGYGLVRAIDEKEHILYIVTPLNLKELQKVNAIIKGNIMVPEAVFLNQPIYNTPLPFTNESNISQPDIDEEMADSSILKVGYTPDLESPAPNLTAHASAERYRRKIPKRHHRNLRK